MAAFGFYFFSMFHIAGKKVPNFAPDFDDPKYTEYGRRDWYKYYIFPGKAKSSEIDGTTEMSYDSKFKLYSHCIVGSCSFCYNCRSL